MKKIIAGVLLLATMTFGMSLSKLNSATKAELMEINGVGEVKATEIIKQRRKGKFKSFEDLMERVDGIGEQTAANIKGDVKNADDVKKVTKKTTKKSKRTTSDSKKKTKSKSKQKLKDIEKKETKSKSKKKIIKKKKRKPTKAEEKEKDLKKKSRKTKKLKIKKLKTKN